MRLEDPVVIHMKVMYSHFLAGTKIQNQISMDLFLKKKKRTYLNVSIS